MDAAEPLRIDPNKVPINADKPQSQHPAYEVADGNAHGAAQEARQQDSDRMQFLLKNEVAREDQQRFIWNRKAENAQHQEQEDPEAAMGNNPFLEVKH